MAALEQWSVKNPAPNRRFEVVAEEVLVKGGDFNSKYQITVPKKDREGKSVF